jgi:nucleoside-diphosphate-sugar epimerase
MSQVFLTGSTGFLGQYILFQLFELGYTDVILHIRPKKNKTPYERLNHVLQNPLFNNVRETILKNVTIVTELKDINVYKNLCVIHSAASVDLSASLRDNMMTNYGFTKELLDLNSYSKFIYISTAYVMKPNGVTVAEPILANIIPNHGEIYNQIMSDKLVFEDIKLHHTNTYALSKAITENLVYEYSQNGNKSFTIIRPSIVNASRSGWNNSLHAGIGKKLLLMSKPMHFIYDRQPIYYDTIPIDDVVERIINDISLESKFCIKYATSGLNNSITGRIWHKNNRVWFIKNYYLYLFCLYVFDIFTIYILCLFKIIPRVVYEKNKLFHNYMIYYQDNNWNFPNTNKPIDFDNYKKVMEHWCSYYLKTYQRNNHLGIEQR